MLSLSILLVLFLIGGCDRQEGTAPSAPVATEGRAAETMDAGADWVKLARAAVARRDLTTADDLLRRRLLTHPDDVEAMELAADVAALRGDRETAIATYRAAAATSERPSYSLLEKLAQEEMRGASPFEAIETLQRLTQLYVDHPEPRYHLAGMATAIGLTEAALPALRWLTQRGQGDPDSLLVLADPDRVEPDPEFCQKILELSAPDRRAEYGLARLASIDGDWETAARRLERVLEQHPDFVPAYVLLGRALVEQGDDEALVQWQRQAPEGADSTAEYWLVAGLWSQRQGRHEMAARALWESLQRDEASQPATWSSLLLSLNQIGRVAEAERVADQIGRLTALRDALKIHMERVAQSQRAAIVVAEAMRDLGRIWEAEAWARLAASLPEDRVPDLRDRYLAIRSQLTLETPWQLEEAMLASKLDLSSLPRVDWIASDSHGAATASSQRGEFYFEDQARERGWVHTCEISPQAEREGHWIYQTLGGGVGVLDFDLDGWPDLAAAMLDGQPLASDSSPNRLFRNIEGHFVDVGAAAGYHDTGFSHGITVGDFNDDGFPDVFDANYGFNRLYRNNGDGTFQDVTEQAGLDGEFWTTSAALVDIDGDGHADLFETAYCSGRAPLEHACRNSRGISTCPPLKFEAEKDRVWRGVGDGTFVDASQAWLDQTTPGRGLGIVAGFFDERPGIDLYIANDMTVNHLWTAERQGDRFSLTDLGSIRGLGLNGRSQSQASMGIAVGDPDSDGDIDFFLTHFSDDHNTYYEQVQPGYWVDRSYPVGLSQPSMKLLGFGTAWCDFDNSGTLELIVSNGHVDHIDRTDVSYRMPAQFFVRGAEGRWSELDRDGLGEYFQSDHLGRALATIDADRDGRTDVAITHLYDPVSLLINRTAMSGKSIGIELKATGGQRDAIGATVTLQVAGRTVSNQLTAGDGYLCTHQRRLNFGIGNLAEVTEVTVTWPSGTTENFGTLEGACDYLLVEGTGEAHILQVHP